ncbi:MAG: hypothetical protein ABJF01_02460 [bacterium]
MSTHNVSKSGEPRGRRAFLGQLAVGAAAGAGAIALTGVSAAVPGSLFAATSEAPDADHWLDALKGKHKQMVDAYNSNEGWPLAFAHTFLASQAPTDTAGAVVVLRHFAMPLALQDSVWAKYKIGEALKIEDPVTKKPAERNPYYKPAKGTIFVDDMAVDRLLARGVIIGACSVALKVLSGMLAGNGGATADAAKAEWTAGIIPGITLLPSGVWGVNRAQEKGCTYVTGG